MTGFEPRTTGVGSKQPTEPQPLPMSIKAFEKAFYILPLWL